MVNNPFELFDQRLASIESILARLEHQNSEPAQTDDFIGVDQAAAYVHLQSSTIYKLVSARKIPFSKIGKRLYFKPSELRAWIAAGRNLTLDEIKSKV
jgi:excisionase family DNA binding protein